MQGNNWLLDWVLQTGMMSVFIYRRGSDIQSQVVTGDLCKDNVTTVMSIQEAHCPPPKKNPNQNNSLLLNVQCLFESRFTLPSYTFMLHYQSRKHKTIWYVKLHFFGGPGWILFHSAVFLLCQCLLTTKFAVLLKQCGLSQINLNLDFSLTT